MLRRWISAAWHRRHGDDSGVTLIELLVSMTIFGIVIATAYVALFTVQQQTSNTMARADAVAQAKLAIAHMDRQIRSGNVLYDPAAEGALGFPMSMRVYTQANGDQKCVQWQIVNGSLRSRSWSPGWQNDPNWQIDNLVSQWQTVGRDIVNQPGVTADTPFKLAGGTSPYSARVVDILLRVKNAQSHGQPYDVTTSLAGRNTVYGYDTSTCSPIPPA